MEVVSGLFLLPEKIFLKEVFTFLLSMLRYRRRGKKLTYLLERHFLSKHPLDIYSVFEGQMLVLFVFVHCDTSL